MVQDARWPALPLLAIRGFQLFFTIMALGMSGYLVSTDHDSLMSVLIQNTSMSLFDYTLADWGFSMALTAAVLTLIYVGVVFVLFFSNLLLPLAIVIVDAVITVLWIVAVGGLGATKLLPVDCSYGIFLFPETYTSTPCRVVKADFGVSFLIFLSFLGTLALGSIILSNSRKDLRGAKYNSGLDPEGNPLPQASVAFGMPNVHGAPENAYYPGQEPKPNYPPTPQTNYAPTPQTNYAPTPQATPAPVYYDYQQHPFISPPGSPAPYMSSQGMPPQGMQPQGMPQRPPAAEMPAR